jgi:hypothetical protein
VNLYLNATKGKYSIDTIHQHLSRQSAVNQANQNVGTAQGYVVACFKEAPNSTATLQQRMPSASVHGKVHAII